MTTNDGEFKIRAVIYARVSTKEQAEGGKISIPNQIEESRKTIINHGWELTHDPYKDEGISGHLIEERRGLQNLLADARQHMFDLVIVKDFDRFARNRAAATLIREELKELFIQTYSISTPVEPKNPKLYDPTDDDLGIMVEGYSDTMSEIERNKIRRRMMIGKVAVAKRGDIPNNAPYGYKIIRWFDEKDKKVLRKIEIDEKQAKTVRWMFDEYIKGKGQLEIAFELNKRHVRPPRGRYWRKQAIKYIIQNQTYTGMVLWGWRHADYEKNKQRKIRGHQGLIVKGNHAAIVTPEIFSMAQKEKKIRGTSQKGRAKLSRGLLTGLAKCIRCGSGVTYLTRHHKRSHKNPKWHDTTTHEYLCGGYKYSGICQRRVMSADRLESFVVSQLRNIVNNPKVREKLFFDKKLDIDGHMKGEIGHAMKILSDIPNKLNREQEAYEAGLITIDEYGTAVKRLRDLEKQYRAVTGDYSERLAKIQERSQELEKYLGHIQNFDELWDSSIFEERKHILRMLIKEIRAGNGKIELDFRI